MRRMSLLGVLLLAAGMLPGMAEAHDDPIVTVRVMCNGFNVLDMDAVLGEISGSATLSIDRPVHGAAEIESWVKDEMNHDLRIEIVDIGKPQPLSDGYTLAWTARFSRQDWRQAGVASREATNLVTIHNGRITEWTASLTADAGSQAAPSALASDPPAAREQPSLAAPEQPSPADGFPSLFGIPVTLYLAAAIIVIWGSWMLRKLLIR